MEEKEILQVVQISEVVHQALITVQINFNIQGLKGIQRRWDTSLLLMFVWYKRRDIPKIHTKLEWNNL